jgi:hypothetical protein
MYSINSLYWRSFLVFATPPRSLGLFSPELTEALLARACSIADRPNRLVGEMLMLPEHKT